MNLQISSVGKSAYKLPYICFDGKKRKQVSEEREQVIILINEVLKKRLKNLTLPFFLYIYVCAWAVHIEED